MTQTPSATNTNPANTGPANPGPTETRPAYTGPDLCALTAREAVALLKARKVSSAELVEASLTRIAQTGPAINAMVTPCPERARAAAAEAGTESLLAGLPIGIKDLTPVAGVRSTWGTPGLADHIPAASDPLVTRLEQRGAVVMGKTNTPEMGAGANTFNPIFGRTRNPWDTRMNPGGSSGGAAAGLATGEVWLSQGSDLGGSLRTPASFCGVVGLRPSPGIAGGASGVDGFSPFGVDGPMARNVADLALFLDAMAGWDPRWPVSFPPPATPYLETCQSAPGAIRIAWAPDLGGLAAVEPAVTQSLQAALQRLAGPQVAVEEIHPDLPGIEESFRTHRALGMWTAQRQTPKRISEQYKQSLRDNIRQGGALTVDALAEAQVLRARLYDRMQRLFESCDVLACPVNGIGPLPGEIEFPPEVAGQVSRDYLDWLRFAFLASLCGLPALSLPVGHLPDGLPVGLQLIGKPRGEARLLQIARQLEEALALPTTPIDPVVRH
jgi:amidase